VVLVVVPGQVVDVAGGDERAAHLARDAHDRLVGLVLGRDPVLLDLEVHVLRAEHLHQLVHVIARLGRQVVDDPAAEARLEAARERDDALGVA
jgi:hypothetical protein